MILFKKLSITSFKSIFKAELDFLDIQNNLYSLEGINNTVDFAASNGSGKSTLCDALSFVLYGTTMGIYLKKEEYQNKFSNLPLKLILDFSIVDNNVTNDFVVERTLNTTTLFKNGENISELTKSETENKLLSIIKITKEEFFSFTYLTQTAGGNFLGKTASEKLAVIKTFIFGEDISQIKQKIDNLLKNYKVSLQEKLNELSKIEGILTGLKKHCEIDEEVAKDVSIDSIEEDKKRLKVLEKKQKDRRQLERDITQLNNVYANLKQNMQQLKQQLKEIKSNTCPLCKQHLIDNTAEITIRDQAAKIKDQAVEVKQQLEELNNRFNLIPVVDADIVKLNSKINYDSLVLSRKSNQKDVLYEIEEKVKEQTIYKEQIVLLQNNVQQLTELQKYFNTIFIQSLQQAFIKEIENYLNLYCYEVFEKSFELRFTNNSLDLFIGDRPYAYFSGGERQRIDLLFVFAIKIALTNFTDKCTNLLILDESLSGSDVVAFNNTIDLIDRLSSASNLTTILVSHRENSNVKNKIVIERNKDSTNLEIVRS